MNFRTLLVALGGSGGWVECGLRGVVCGVWCVWVRECFVFCLFRRIRLFLYNNYCWVPLTSGPSLAPELQTFLQNFDEFDEWHKPFIVAGIFLFCFKF